jgi:hypothetical protein
VYRGFKLAVHEATSEGKRQKLAITARVPLAGDMLSRNSMNTTFLEIYVGALIFAACNMAYFEARRLIQQLKGKFDKSELSQEQSSSLSPPYN